MFKMGGDEVEKPTWVFSLKTAYLAVQSCCSGPQKPASWIAANRWCLEGQQMTLGKLQMVADVAEASGHLCSGAHAIHLACLHLLNPPITSAMPQGLQIKFLRRADIRPKEREYCHSVHILTSNVSALWKLWGKWDGLRVLSSSVDVLASVCSKLDVWPQPVGRGRESWLGSGLKSSILLENNPVFPGGGSLSYMKEKCGNSNWDKPTRRNFYVLDIYNIPDISFRNFHIFSGFFLSNDTSRLKYYLRFTVEEIQAHWFHSLVQGQVPRFESKLVILQRRSSFYHPSYSQYCCWIGVGELIKATQVPPLETKSEILRWG